MSEPWKPMSYAKSDLANRLPIAAARAQGRCQCMGCAACRGEYEYPCAAMLPTWAESICRHCARAAR